MIPLGSGCHAKPSLYCSRELAQTFAQKIDANTYCGTYFNKPKGLRHHMR